MSDDLSPMLPQYKEDTDRSPRLGGSRKVLTPAEERAQQLAAMRETIRQINLHHEESMRHFAAEFPEEYAEMVRRDAERVRHDQWNTPYGLPRPIDHIWQVMKAQWSAVNAETRFSLANMPPGIDEVMVEEYDREVPLAGDLMVATTRRRRYPVEQFAANEFGYMRRHSPAPSRFLPNVLIRAAYDTDHDGIYIHLPSNADLTRLMERNYARATFRACFTCHALMTCRIDVDHLRGMTEFTYQCRACNTGAVRRITNELIPFEREHWINERETRRQAERDPNHYRGLR